MPWPIASASIHNPHLGPVTKRCQQVDGCAIDLTTDDGWCLTCEAFVDAPRGRVAVEPWVD